MFDPESRYASLAIAELAAPGREPIAYVRRRFLPQGAALPLLAETSVAQGERLDQITTRTLGAPEQFWRVCDANDAMNPFDLVAAAGRTLRIPIPQR
jgi:hypothetical protein